jgi:hypothetical protein
MLKTGVFRWHTFRLMLITSLIWVIFGVCVLVYYMDCLTGNSIKCKRGTILTSHNAINEDISNSNNDYLNIHYDMTFHHKEDHISLPHYSSKELKSWKPVGLCRVFYLILTRVINI